jgi:hypothetical protein
MPGRSNDGAAGVETPHEWLAVRAHPQPRPHADLPVRHRQGWRTAVTAWVVVPTREAGSRGTRPPPSVLRLRVGQTSCRVKKVTTQAGLAAPSTVMVMVIVSCSPPVTSVTSSRTAVALTLLPTGTGLGNRTFSQP